jgi:hypothetical protein
MAYSFEFDSESGTLLARFKGQVTSEAFGEFYNVSVPQLAANDKIRGWIVDFSSVSSFEVSPETIRALAWSRPADPDSSRTRVFVAPAPNVYGLARMFVSHGDDTRPNLHVVRSMEDAYAVLGISKPKFEPFGKLG